MTPTPQKPTDTAGLVAEWCDWLREQCNTLKYGTECRTCSCLIRGGWSGKGPTKGVVGSCIPKEIVEALTASLSDDVVERCKKVLAEQREALQFLSETESPWLGPEDLAAKYPGITEDMVLTVIARAILAEAGGGVGVGETQESMEAWATETFGAARSLNAIWDRTREELEELRLALSDDMNAEAKIAEELADVTIMLFRMAAYIDHDLLEEIDRKMKINRQREWQVRGDGTGHRQHKPPPPSTETDK